MTCSLCAGGHDSAGCHHRAMMAVHRDGLFEKGRHRRFHVGAAGELRELTEEESAVMHAAAKAGAGVSIVTQVDPSRGTVTVFSGVPPAEDPPPPPQKPSVIRRLRWWLKGNRDA